MSRTALFPAGECRVLFIGGSIGLGHVTRDMAIAAALRALRPGLDLKWLAADPARRALKTEGELLVPEADAYLGETELAEESRQGLQPANDKPHPVAPLPVPL